MTSLDLARLQFGATTVYHFLFVPMTMGIAPLVAIFHTCWLRTGNTQWYKLTRFFGKLLLITFGIGVATGIVQEFQFGMNWSEYSRFVGDVFGAPLAVEGLAAFFLESTFLGLWVFGWDRLPRYAHLACAWLFALGTWLSAYFIIAANTFMQHPLGARYNPETGRAELESISALLFNETTAIAFAHVMAGAVITGGTLVSGIAAWWMVKAHRAGNDEVAHAFRRGMVVGLISLVIGGGAVLLTGDAQAKLLFRHQPMKMAAAEGLCQTESGVPLSMLTVGMLDNDCDGVERVVGIPKMLSFLVASNTTEELKGVDQLQTEYAAMYGATNAQGEVIDYRPHMFTTYWSFRLMFLLAAFSAALALVGLWLTRKKRLSDKKWFAWLGLIALPMPVLCNSFGWIMTEVGRQPWIVAPNPTGSPNLRLMVAQGVSDHPTWLVATSMIGFTLLYGLLAVIWYKLVKRYTVEGLSEEPEPQKPSERQDELLHFAY